MLFQRFSVNWLKRAKTHIQRKLANLRSARAYSFQDFLGKMKTRGGGSNRARIPGKHGLIAFAIRRLVCAFDVRRQRHVAKPLHMLVHGSVVMRDEAQRAQTEFPLRGYFAFQFPFAKKNALPDVHLSSRPHQRLPRVAFDLAR